MTRETGTLLIIDETHTICAGPGGYTGAYGLEPDMLVDRQAIAGGIPAGVYGFTEEVADRIRAPRRSRTPTSVASAAPSPATPLSLAAMRATLTEVLTDAPSTG